MPGPVTNVEADSELVVLFTVEHHILMSMINLRSEKITPKSKGRTFDLH